MVSGGGNSRLGMVLAIIDDDKDVRRATERMLELCGYETTSFASGDEFLAVDPTQFSFLLIDNLMPHMTGLDLLAELRRRSCATPAAIMTGSYSNELRDRAMKLVACRVFSKPVSWDELVATVRSAGV
jgi:FixJ family two-component response regulator